MFSSPCLQPSSASTPPTSLSKKNTATMPSKTPQPYGVIPPRRKRTAALSSTSPSSTPSRPCSLLPTTPTLTSDNNKNNNSSRGHDHLVRAFQSIMVSESTSSARLGLWDSLKEHYQAATRILPWGSTLRDDCSTTDSVPALTIPSSSPIVLLDATPMITSSSSADDTLLSLPDIDSLPTDNSSKHEFSVMGPYQVSVVAMDKLMVAREVIPLKTFTYCETAVKAEGEAKHASQYVGSASPSSVKRSLKKAPSQRLVPSCRSKTAPRASTPSAATSCEGRDDLPPLPRHLAIRDTRSNPDYLRMMACEMRMIRSLKLVSPLKPRGYLPRRKELFNTAKSPLSVSVEMPCEEEDSHQHPLFVGSWTSVSSAETFLSATSSSSSDYASADEDF